ncbi:MAG TPA: hypothetical protein DCX06_13810 [Opitutae bacterium]|nr:hypothetical protein [Opitutae bacterium]
MPDYYIRTPDNNESRGPFDPIKLQTLAEAGQITENSLYYDESKEEWIPIALNKELHAEVFPKRESLSLKIKQSDKAKKKEEKERDPGGLNVQEMLDAADGNTKQRKSVKQKEESLHKSAAMSAPSLGFMTMASAIFLLYPHFDVLSTISSENRYADIINYPFAVLGFLDLLLGILLFLSVTEVYPIIRGRSMLTLGFGVYVGWALGDPIIMALSAAAGAGMFIASITQRASMMFLAILLGVGGNGYFAYLASIGRFDEFFDTVVLDLISS